MSAVWSRRPFALQPGAEPHREHADKCSQDGESTLAVLEAGRYDPLSGLPHIQACRLFGDERRSQALRKRRTPVAWQWSDATVCFVGPVRLPTGVGSLMRLRVSVM